MKKALVMAAVLSAWLMFSGFDFLGLFGKTQAGETPERLFNMANEAMIKGKNTEAIDLYYRLIEKHPEFKTYRADALYRLGTLLYRAERFEEAEKILSMLAVKYRNYVEIRVVYEKLLYIYAREFRDNARAKKIREIYEKRYGKGKVLLDADKTERILNAAGGSDILKMPPPEIGVVSVEESDSYDAEFFPVKCVLKNVSVSPGRSMTLERKKNGGKYFLFVSAAGKKAVRLKGTKNGFAPQWSWDDKYASYTAMDWAMKERYVKLYSAEKGASKNLFAARDVGPLTCPAPDASLVAFWYLDGLWLVNRSGISVSLITKKVSAKDVFMMAWSRDGDKILVGRKIKGRERYYTCNLGRKEFIIVK